MPRDFNIRGINTSDVSLRNFSICNGKLTEILQ